MQKVLIVFGTRPEAIKMAPLIKEFQRFPDHFETIICVTGQHRQMLDQVLTVFDVKPDFDLQLMKSDQDLYHIFSSVLNKFREVCEKVRPDLVFVQGDTSTSTASALAAFFQKIPVAHIEAGLRTNNPYSPWPEEINRQITTRLAKYHFAPTLVAKNNLLKENVDENKIHVTGNTVIDAIQMIVKKLNDSKDITTYILEQITEKGYDLNRLSGNRKLILITGHRRENFGTGLENICNAIKTSSEHFSDFDFLYPVHFNPNVRHSVNKILGGSTQENIFIIDPVDYIPFVYLMQRCFLILTDSGGIQEEASELCKPVLVMRENTERPEALEAGISELIGTDQDKIFSSLKKLITDKEYYLRMTHKKNPFGDGKASERIVNYFLNMEF